MAASYFWRTAVRWRAKRSPASSRLSRYSSTRERKPAPEDQRRDGDHQAEGGAVERDRDVRQLRRIARAGRTTGRRGAEDLDHADHRAQQAEQRGRRDGGQGGR